MSVGQNTDDAVSLLEAWVGGYTTADGAVKYRRFK